MDEFLAFAIQTGLIAEITGKGRKISEKEFNALPKRERMLLLYYQDGLEMPLSEYLKMFGY